MHNLERRIFYTFQSYGPNEVGIKVHDGFSAECNGLKVNLHIGSNNSVVITDDESGASIMRIPNVEGGSELEKVENALETFLGEEELILRFIKYRESEEYECIKVAFKCIIGAKDFLTSNRCKGF